MGPHAKCESHIAVRRDLKITYLHHAEPVHVSPQRMRIAARYKRDADLKPSPRNRRGRYVSGQQRIPIRVYEQIIGRPIDIPAPLADALARPRHILRLPASLDA